MNRFEDKIHAARRTDGEQTTEQFSQLWYDTQHALYGDSVELTDEYKLWWCYIPHFLHTPGYVYAYAFGELLVLALYDAYRNGQEGFADNYIELLEAGGSDWPHNIVSKMGIDIRDESFWNRGLTLFEDMITRAEELAKEIADSWIPFQFSNPSNIDSHRKNTAMEIIEDFPKGIDYLITGVGTGGHISGVAEILKKKFKNLKVFAVEPEGSPVIGGGEPGPHQIQGIGAGFITDVLDLSLIDMIETVEDEEALEFSRRAAKEEGIICGISSGAAIAVATRLAKQDRFEGKTIVAILPDSGERYLSTVLFNMGK
jgi:hypothetical protein